MPFPIGGPLELSLYLQSLSRYQAPTHVKKHTNEHTRASANKRNNELTNQPTNKHDGSQYPLAEVIIIIQDINVTAVLIQFRNRANHHQIFNLLFLVQTFLTKIDTIFWLTNWKSQCSNKQIKEKLQPRAHQANYNASYDLWAFHSDYSECENHRCRLHGGDGGDCPTAPTAKGYGGDASKSPHRNFVMLFFETVKWVRFCM